MELLTIKEVAELRGCNRSRIQQLVSDGTYKTVDTKNSRNRIIHALSLIHISIEQVLQFMQIPYLLDGILLIAGSVAIFNYWLIQHRLQKRREKGL